MRQPSFFPHTFFSSRRSWKWFILSTVLLGATMSALDVSIVNVAMPTLMSSFGVSMAVIEWVAMGYMLTLTILLPLFGRLADRYGRSKLYNIGFVVFSVGSLLCGIAPSAGFLIFSRVVQAVGAGLLQANSVALITHAFPGRERGKAIGIQGAVQAISMAVGPFVGGMLISAVGWRYIFYVNLPIGLLGTLAALFILPPDSRPARKEKVDYVGAALFASGLAFVVLAFNESAKLGWTSQVIAIYLVSGVALLGVFAILETQLEYPLVDLRLFRNSTFLLGNLNGMISYYVLFSLMFLLPFYLQTKMGYSSQLTGILLTPVPIAMAIVAPIAGHVSDKHGPRIMTTSGMLVSGLACLCLLFQGLSGSMPLLIADLFVFGVGMGLFTPPNNSAIMGSAPSDKLGVAGGVLNMMRSLGLIFGVDISGVLFTSLRRHYLAERGYSQGVHVLDKAIPTAIRNDAFMHGFLTVTVVLFLLNFLSALFSAMNKGQPTLQAKPADAEVFLDVA